MGINKFVAVRDADYIGRIGSDGIGALDRGTSSRADISSQNRAAIAHAETSVMISVFNSVLHDSLAGIASDYANGLFELPIDLQEALAKLHKLLVTLSQSDRSEDGDFIQELCSIWRRLTEHVRCMVQSAQMSTAMLSRGMIQLDNLVQMISNYPQTESTTIYHLGYYLGNVKDGWTPRPFVALLQQLHQDAQPPSNSLSSPLLCWIETAHHLL